MYRAPVVQWIERKIPDLVMLVRVQPEAQKTAFGRFWFLVNSG